MEGVTFSEQAWKEFLKFLAGTKSKDEDMGEDDIVKEYCKRQQTPDVDISFVLELLREEKEPLTFASLMDMTGKSSSWVRRHICEHPSVVKLGHGLYQYKGDNE